MADQVVNPGSEEPKAKSSALANAYITLVIAVGFTVLLYAALHWRLDSPAEFSILLVSGLIVAHWKVRLPTVNGTMSVLCILTFFAVSGLNVAEAVVVVSAASLSQCTLFVKRRVRLVQVSFNIASMAFATFVTDMFYQWGLFGVWHVPPAIRLMLAAGVFYFFNTVPIAIVISLTESRPFRTTWVSCYLWSFPFYLVGSGVAAIANTATHTLGWQTSVAMIPIIYVIYRSYDLYVGRMERDRKHAQEISGLHLRTIEALALAIEAKDQTTANHLARVQVYAVDIGKTLGMNAQEIEALRAASLLHDIGKLAVPEHIISKPGKLTREEFEKMKIHPVVGAEILERVNFPYPVTPIVRSHHEKWNGEGYPDGLRGEDIPLGARILSAVDCLDALCSDRQYRKALPLDEAMAIVSSESGKSFDPKVVEVLAANYRELEHKAHAKEMEDRRAGLSIEMRVERGEAPAAGFESVSAAAPVGPKPLNFVTSIASARQEMHSLWELTRDLGACISLQDALSVFSVRLKDLIPFDCVAVYTIEGDLLKPKHVVGENFRFFSALEIPMGMGLSGWVAENAKAIINGNPAVESGHLEKPTRFTTMRAALSVPLETGERVIGVLTLYQADRDSFSQDNLRVLLSIAPKLAQTIEASQRFERAETSAATDYMTGLPNARSMFLHLDSEIARCERVQIPLCLVVGDLDGFKQVNDQLGHLMGDEVLRRVADALRSRCRPYDYVARMGGDEFIIILPEVEAPVLEERLKELRAAVVSIGAACGPGLPLSISFGTVTYGIDGKDPDRLLAKADQIMYEAKRRRPLMMPEPAPLKRLA